MVIRCNFGNGIIPVQIPKSVKVYMCIFVLALTVSEILTFQIVYLKKVGQIHDV